MWLIKYQVTSRALEFARANMVPANDEFEHKILAELCGHAKRFHLLFDRAGCVVGEVPWQDDDNHGLPQWYFDAVPELLSMEVDLDLDKIEWVPAIGPAPCWIAKFSDFSTDEEIWTKFNTWFRATY